jgi:excisionase family DNA binding protein
MQDAEFAAHHAISLAKRLGLPEVTPDELLLGALHALSVFGIVRLGPWTIDLEALGVPWTEPAEPAKVAYSQAVVDQIDQAARIAWLAGPVPLRATHVLATFANEESGLMGQLKQTYNIASATWRAALAELEAADAALKPAPAIASSEPAAPAPKPQTTRDYLTPEEAADALGIHVQTLRASVRSGKLPATRLAGERAIRIRREDLPSILEPFEPQT